MSTFSIIIPVLNESEFFIQQRALLTSIIRRKHEIIVVDGGSTDTSIADAKNIGCVCISTKASRGFQLHVGANQSVNEILVFLHADSILTLSGIDQIASAFTKTRSSWGRFDIEFTSKSFVFKTIAWFMNKRSCLTGIATGDQAIFVKRKSYFDTGGFSDIQLMEDIELCKRLKKLSKPVCLRDTVITSSRKWEQQGILKTILLMWRLRIMYFFGASPEELVKQYYS